MCYIRRIANRFMAVQADTAAPLLGLIGAAIVLTARNHGVPA